jgi:glycine hydroxymethyltransferase
MKEALSDTFNSYQLQIVKNAKAMAETLMAEGFRLVSGGTDNHLMLVDLTDKGLTGKDAGEALDRAGITANKNMIPFDTRTPMVTSGVRMGTPAVTTRGMKEDDMRTIARLIAHILKDIHDENRIREVKREVSSLCERFPLYRERIEKG